MTQQSNKSDGAKIYRRLLSYAFPYWKVFVLAVIGMVIYAATEVSFTKIIQPMLDDGFTSKDPKGLVCQPVQNGGLVNNDPKTILYHPVHEGGFVTKDPKAILCPPMLDNKIPKANIWVPIILILIFTVRIIGTFLSEYGMALIARNVIRDLRLKVFTKILCLPISYFDTTSSGSVLSKMIYDIEQVAAAASGVIIVLIRDGLTVLALFAYMLYLSPLLTLVLFVTIPFVAAMVYFISKRFRLLGTRIQNSMGGVTNITEEAIQANREIKIFGGQKFESNRFTSVNNYNRLQHLKLVAANALSSPIIQLIVAVAFAFMIYMATNPDFVKDLSVGYFVSFLMAMIMLLQHAKRLTTINVTLQKGIAASESVFEFIDIPDEDDKGQTEIAHIKGDVNFDKVNFSYVSENENVLSDISLSIKAGETVAFVGRSGAGKSTLVSLLPRFYEKTTGSITIDGHEVDTLKLSNLRNHVALVNQDVTLFNDTIAHNIAYSDLENIDESKIMAAAKAAHALEFIEKLPLGMDTIVGEDGVLLSGGQRQRIAIARAILKDAPVLILDEATSSLDTESERYIQAALDELIKTRTTLVIAHRLSTIENADKIVVLDKGNIVETGTHAELIAKAGHYAALHNMQFKNNKDNEVAV